MKYFISGILLFFSLGSLSAQTFAGKLNPFPSSLSATADDTVKILAVMVSFQEDRDGATFGNGKFGTIYSQNYGSDILDPLPHDKDYFDSHLQFVQNYFSKVSKGKQHIVFNILPDTFSVSQTMRNYSPPPNSDDFEPLADFATEAWTLADAMYAGFNFSEYDLFLIFHAGVGRDVTLPGSIGNERDLPSVYLSEKAFKEIYGENFDGIPVSGGSFNITNSMIMPETESRELQTITGTFLFEITINGLLCASVASHLGLPDLFDTETGLSAIGRFGLMDGQGIFAYGGTYPPEPSPWSKIRLGWAEPVTLDIAGADISLVTNLAATMSDTVILKVPLNSTEYFLIENRARDAFGDGSKVTYTVGGNVIEKTFLKDSTGYRSFDVDSLAGVILDVDEFDWAVPGSGILIWHIDENVIEEKIDDNAINTDKNRRGVDVEEADGVQDIGETFITIFGDEVIGEGTQEDLWYASNPTGLFENRFAKDTRPNNLTNSGANSLITIKDFSEISNRMNFKIEFGDSVVKPLFSNNIDLVAPITSLSSVQHLNNNFFSIIANDEFILIKNDTIINISPSFSSYKSSSVSIGNTLFNYGGINNTLNSFLTDDANFYVGQSSVNAELTTPPVVFENSSQEFRISVGTADGKIFSFSTGSLPSNDPEILDSIIVNQNTSIRKIGTNGPSFALIAVSNETPGNSLFSFNASTIFNFTDEVAIDLVLTESSDNKVLSLVLTDKNKIYVFAESELIKVISINAIDTIKSISLTDLKQDGTNYIAVNNGINIEVYNLTGAMADNFPFTDPEGIGFSGTPLTADFEGDNNSEIISVTKDGRIFVIDGGTGKVVPGFPISVGGSVSVTPVLYNANEKTNLAVLNDDGVLSAWSISSVEGKLYWSEEFGNPQNTSFVEAAENTNRINEFFPTSRAYNYPNPVYEGNTNIRYYVSEDSKINIKIFDLAGDFVAELNDDAAGGMDNETVWNVGDVQSGVYFARIEATGSSGKSEYAIIKIAVVK